MNQHRQLNRDAVEIAARNFWESESHPEVEHHIGMPATWSNIPEALRRKVRGRVTRMIRDYLTKSNERTHP